MRAAACAHSQKPFMQHAIKFSPVAISLSCFAIAACGGSGDSVLERVATIAAVKPAAASAVSSSAVSASGTTIPSAAAITDRAADRWTVTDGVVAENGAPAGYSKNVTLLLYDDAVIYQENAAGGWWSWSGGSWVSSSDPRKHASPSGTTIPGSAQITDASGNVWTVSAGVIYENGTLAGYSKGVVEFAYDDAIIYQENAAGGWWSWNGSTWESSSAAPKTPSPSGTVITAAGQITDASGNLWSVSGGVVYENGASAGYSKAVIALAYENGVVYQENAADAWWGWTAGSWGSSPDPVGATTTLAISGSPVTSDIVGEAYSFVPTTSNSSGAALRFSIANMPAWGNFNTATGELTGTPSNVQAGAYPNIAISVAGGGATASLAVFSITVTTGSATLSWTAPTQNTNGTPLTDLAGYTIYYGTSANSLTETIQVADPSVTSYVLGNLVSGTYYFSIAAYGTNGLESAETSPVSKTVI